MSEQKYIPKPSYTQQPNVIYDVWMRELSGSEYKVVSVIARKTFGYHKEQDAISISQLCEMSGLAKNTVIDACTSLINKGYITATKQEDDKVNLTTVYAFVFSDDGGSAEIEPPRSAKIELGGSAEIEPTKESNANKEKKTTLSDKLTVQVDTEQTQVNDEKVSPPKQPAKNKPVNVGYELGLVVNELLDVPSTYRKIGYALAGTGKAHPEVASIFKDKPVTCDEFRSFVTWFKNKYPSLSLKSPLTIANYIADYRKQALLPVPELPAPTRKVYF